MRKTYQIECGGIQGFCEAKNEAVAFRKAVRLNKIKRRDWGELVRFREVVLDKFEIVKRGKWFYQKPQSLLLKK